MEAAPSLPGSASLGGGLQGSTHTSDGRVLPTLGPVTERFVVVKKGQDVVLECRDADDNWVYWRKHGGKFLNFPLQPVSQFCGNVISPVF